MNKTKPLIQIVNENDEVIGSAPKREAQEKGLIHRIAQIMVEDPEGRLLLQKRSLLTEFRPGQWDTSVGGHVDAGENYLDAAIREMQEEIGIKNLELLPLGKYRKNSRFEWRYLNRFYMAYRVLVPADTSFKLDPDEVAEVRWFTLEEVTQLLKQKKEEYSNGLKEVINRFYISK
jgi:16S rRNA (adenine1518-N6/adenine1519-N6)-dimethyltransferase